MFSGKRKKNEAKEEKNIHVFAGDEVGACQEVLGGCNHD